MILDMVRELHRDVKPSNRRPGAKRFMLVGRNPAVDFVNTVIDPNGEPAGAVRSRTDLLALLELTGNVPASDVAIYRAMPARRGWDCAEAFTFALKLRDSLRSAFDSLARGGGVRSECVDLVNRILASDAGCQKLVPAGQGWKLTQIKETEGPIAVLLPIARATAKIIGEGPAAHIRKC